MRALTVQQPWAWAIIHGGKNIENRTQAWRYRGPLAIHAGLRYSPRGFDALARICGLHLPPWNTGHPTEVQGAIIGVVDLVDIHAALPGCCDSPWAEYADDEHPTGKTRRDITHLVLERPRPLVEPIVCRGRLGLWTIPDHLIGDHQ